MADDCKKETGGKLPGNSRIAYMPVKILIEKCSSSAQEIMGTGRVGGGGARVESPWEEIKAFLELNCSLW